LQGGESINMESEVDIRKIGEKGRELFKKISEELERDYRGKFVAIEVDSSDYFIGDTSIEADKKARKKYPDKVFYLGRIGYRAAVSFKGR
jgi:hypothetical protein